MADDEEAPAEAPPAPAEPEPPPEPPPEPAPEPAAPEPPPAEAAPEPATEVPPEAAPEAAPEAPPEAPSEAAPAAEAAPEGEAAPAAEAPPAAEGAPEAEGAPAGEGEPEAAPGLKEGAPVPDPEGAPAPLPPETEEGAPDAAPVKASESKVVPETRSKTVLRQQASSAVMEEKPSLVTQPSRVRVQEPSESATGIADDQPIKISASKTRKDSDVGIEPLRKASRMSKTKTAMGSQISIRRSSVTGDMHDKGRYARYANTYKLNSDNPFKVEVVEKILENIMTETIEGLTYDTDRCPKQAKMASAAIRLKVKELEYDRYRILSIVTIGEKASQDVHVGCRFLWDPERDKYAKFVTENMHVFAIALCFGLYYE